MSQSLSRILIHVIFSTKHREAMISERFEEGFHRYLGGILRNLDCPPIQIGGVEDHVHLLFGLGRTVAMADLVREVKAGSSAWAKESVVDFAWQAGYGAFSVSESKVEDVMAYIRGQREHHRRLPLLRATVRAAWGLLSRLTLL